MFFYISTNLPRKAREHFWGIREAKNDLVGLAIFDRIDAELKTDTPLYETMWQKREIENYFCFKEVFTEFAKSMAEGSGPLFDQVIRKRNIDEMTKAIAELELALKTLDKGTPWSDDFKVSDDFMEPLFRKYSEKLSIPLVLRKKEFYKLIKFLERDSIENEIKEKLGLIMKTAKKAKPLH